MCLVACCHISLKKGNFPTAADKHIHHALNGTHSWEKEPL